ncbi:hypothetical protein FKM82_011474 [Ascaphus truei]
MPQSFIFSQICRKDVTSRSYFILAQIQWWDVGLEPYTARQLCEKTMRWKVPGLAAPFPVSLPLLVLWPVKFSPAQQYDTSPSACGSWHRASSWSSWLCELKSDGTAKKI